MHSRNEIQRPHKKPAGEHEVEFEASEFPSGIYFYRLETGRSVITKKMILLQ